MDVIPGGQAIDGAGTGKAICSAEAVAGQRPVSIGYIRCEGIVGMNYQGATQSAGFEREGKIVGRATGSIIEAACPFTFQAVYRGGCFGP